MNIIPTAGMTQEEIFAGPRKGKYTASETAILAACGYSKSSRYQLFMQHAYDVQPEFDQATQDIFWFGHALEPVIAARFALETGLEFADHQVLVQHPQYDYMTCLIDGVTTCGQIVDFKALFSFNARNLISGDNSTLPMKAHIQAAHQMACCEVDHAHWACYSDMKLYRFIIPRDDEVIELVLQLIADFKHHVDTLTPPSEFEAADVDILRKQYQFVDDSMILDLTHDDQLDLRAARFLEAKSAQSYAEKEEKKCHADLLGAMGMAASAELLNHTLERKHRSRKGVGYVQLLCKPK